MNTQIKQTELHGILSSEINNKIDEMAIQLLHNLSCNNYEVVIQATEDCCTKKLHISIILYKVKV